jgi:nucleoside-diphosphate-sugar epimerase
LKALVIGGTGPTGPHIINGLLQRGYDVTMLNRGSRDSAMIPPSVKRVIGDPHFPDTLEAALQAERFDLVVATYGRIRYVADVMADKTDRFISVGGPPSYLGFTEPGALAPKGMVVPTHEDAALVQSSDESRFGGNMNVTHFRYPSVYGPGQVRPTTLWWVMQRCLDKRDFVVLPEGGLTLFTRGYSQNVAEVVMLAVDQPEQSAGQIYNCGDDIQYTLAQWVEMIAGLMNTSLEVVSVPDAFASASRDLMQFKGTAQHQFLDLAKAREQLGYRDRVNTADAVRQTVQWFQRNPPQDEAFIADLRAHYVIEDQLAEIQRSAAQAMAALEHLEEDFHHSYAHPRERGLRRDHRNR